jgi:DNA topoisomerase-3
MMSLYDVPLLKIPVDGEGGSNVIRNLKECSKDISSLMIWTDCDREGEAIGFDVIDAIGKESLDIYRAKFSALTKKDIEDAIDNLVKPQKSLSDAVKVRQEVDLRIGASFTRFQTLALKKELPNEKSVLSYGSCQFPTLGFVV